MDKTLVEFLNVLVQDPKNHAKWLNTLSFLEYIGARKIIKSQDASSLNMMMLEHISEEVRHAYFFKSLSEKAFPGTCVGYHDRELLAGRESEDYFQSLDVMVTEELVMSKTLLNYLYVTWLIEKRALWLYKLYSQVLGNDEVGVRLRVVLNEEGRHLEEMRTLIEKIDFKSSELRQKTLSEKEELRFKHLLQFWIKGLSSWEQVSQPSESVSSLSSTLENL